MPRGTSPLDEARLQGRLWTPAANPELLTAWWKFNDIATISTVSGAVTQVLDKSGKGRTLFDTQATGSRRPTYSQSSMRGNGGVTFAAAQFLSSGAFEFAPSGRFCIIAIAENASENYGRLVISNGNGNASYQSQYLGNGAGGASLLSIHKNASIAAPNVAKSGIANGELIIAEQVVSTADIAAATNSVRFNGQTPVTLATDGTGIDTTTGLTIGNNNQDRFAGTEAWGAAIGEVICTGALSLNQLLRMEGYLAWGWGRLVSLPANHPYRNRPPLIGA